MTSRKKKYKVTVKWTLYGNPTEESVADIIATNKRIAIARAMTNFPNLFSRDLVNSSDEVTFIISRTD